MASDAGYGFVTTLEDLQSRQRVGKSVLNLPRNSRVLPPRPVGDGAEFLAAVSSLGRLLVFPLEQLPHLAKGKGSRLIGIPPAQAAARQQLLVAFACLASDQSLTLYCGQRHLTLKPADLANYAGARAQRGRQTAARIPARRPPGGFRSARPACFKRTYKGLRLLLAATGGVSTPFPRAGRADRLNHPTAEFSRRRSILLRGAKKPDGEPRQE